jgi:hypothetical protein
MNKNDWDSAFELNDILRMYPDLEEKPEFAVCTNHSYPSSAENMFEMIAKYCKEKTNILAERMNIINPYEVDMIIKEKSTGKPIYILDLEADNTGAFAEDGTFKYWNLTIPYEKGKYFDAEHQNYKNYGLPFIYLKFASDMRYCYLLHCTKAISEDLFNKLPKLRKIHQTSEIKEYRKMYEIHSRTAFRKHDPIGVHRVEVSKWLVACSFLIHHKEWDKQKLDIPKNQKTLGGFI